MHFIITSPSRTPQVNKREGVSVGVRPEVVSIKSAFVIGDHAAWIKATSEQGRDKIHEVSLQTSKHLKPPHKRAWSALNDLPSLQLIPFSLGGRISCHNICSSGWELTSFPQLICLDFRENPCEDKSSIAALFLSS